MDNNNKMNLILGLNGLIVVWLLALTVAQFSGGSVGKSDIEQTKAALNGGAENPSGQPITYDNNGMPTIQPTNANNPQAPAAIDPALATTIAFQEESFDFGTLKAGEKMTHKFKFKNTGTKPLTISNARGSCGCTVPEWPKEPIAPGESGTINVEFNSEGKNGKQTKTVTINANIPGGETRLTISADVIGGEVNTTGPGKPATK